MSFTPIVMAVFWVCLALLFYAYVGYPVLVWCLARCFGRQVDPPPVPDEDLPMLSLLVAAHNEEGEIEKWIQTSLQLDYPANMLDIVVASDGSTDATPEIVRRYAPQGVRLLEYKQRRGKAAVLNSAFAELRGEIVLLSDANTHIDRGAARRLVRWFQDPRVGAVCGRLILTDPATGRNVDSLYWKYETFLKKCEGKLGALLGANGAIYVIRRAVPASLPDDTIVDDFFLPLQARLRTDCAIVYDEKAVAWEETPAGIRSEFQRRSRIGAGGFQSLVRLWRLLYPSRGWIAFTFFSHKILRWFGPFFLLGLLGSSLGLLEQPFYRWALLGQLGFYVASWLVALVPARIPFVRPLRLLTMFTSMNLALLVGFWRWLCGSQKGTWQRTARLAEAKEPVR